MFFIAERAPPTSLTRVTRVHVLGQHSRGVEGPAADAADVVPLGVRGRADLGRSADLLAGEFGYPAVLGWRGSCARDADVACTALLYRAAELAEEASVLGSVVGDHVVVTTDRFPAAQHDAVEDGLRIQGVALIVLVVEALDGSMSVLVEVCGVVGGGRRVLELGDSGRVLEVVKAVFAGLVDAGMISIADVTNVLEKRLTIGRCGHPTTLLLHASSHSATESRPIGDHFHQRQGDQYRSHCWWHQSLGLQDRDAG